MAIVYIFKIIVLSIIGWAMFSVLDNKPFGILVLLMGFVLCVNVISHDIKPVKEKVKARAGQIYKANDSITKTLDKIDQKESWLSKWLYEQLTGPEGGK